MNYYFNINLGQVTFEEAVDRVIADLKEEGFGIISDIDMKETLKKKIDVDFKKYRILGACNPSLAYSAIQKEDKIGLMLPCNVVVEENETGEIEVSIIDPTASMMAIQNNDLEEIAKKVKNKLLEVAKNLEKRALGV